jgi:hypothetical protein
MVDRLILVVIAFLSFTCWGENNQTSHTSAPVPARFSDEVVIKLAQNLAASALTGMLTPLSRFQKSVSPSG